MRQTQTIRNYSLARYDANRLRVEHRAIIEALRGGAVEQCLAALRAHLDASLQEFLSRPPDEMPTRG
jgi:DNA-binding GntR family transcriptional regulator